MLVMVATRESQGSTAGDYCDTVEGELVTPLTTECCTPDTCGCGRGFRGFASCMATTTAMVVERPGLTIALLRGAIADALDRDGWNDGAHPEAFEQLIDQHVDVITRVSRTFGEGAVVRRDGSTLWADVAPPLPNDRAEPGR